MQGRSWGRKEHSLISEKSVEAAAPRGGHHQGGAWTTHMSEAGEDFWEWQLPVSTAMAARPEKRTKGNKQQDTCPNRGQGTMRSHNAEGSEVKKQSLHNHGSQSGQIGGGLGTSKSEQGTDPSYK